MGTRTDLVVALNSVAGVTASPYLVPSTAPGTAYPQMQRVEFVDAFSDVATWQIYVLCPQDWAATEKYVEHKIPLIKAALARHLTLVSAEVSRLQIPSVGEIPALIFTGRREADSN